MEENKKVIIVLIAMCTLFFSLVGYLTYIQVFQGKKLSSNIYNGRQYEVEDNTIRGKIFDRKGTVLADTTKEESTNERVYPFGALYSHVIGYSSKVYSKSLLESSYNNYLLGLDEYTTAFGIIKRVGNKETLGNNVYLTIDHNLQKLGQELMKGKRGAIVVMNPKTGEVLAMVSKPDFDPNNEKLVKNWRGMIESEDSPFLPRATQGLYVPGSIFKVLATTGAIENNLEGLKFNDKGVITIDGYQIQNSKGKAYGNIDLKKALAKSSNVAYAELGVKLGEKNLKELALKFGMEKSLPFDIPLSKSRFPYTKMDDNDMAAVAIGQGKTLVTPMHMAMITSSIANKGIMVKPILVDHIESASGKEIKSFKTESLFRVMDSSTAEKLNNMMEEVVKSGTGKNAQIKGVRVAGKTGTAENELTEKQKNKEHAWFIGFAPAENPQVAVAVVIEYSGSSGGSVAAPIARKMMAQCLKK